MRRRPLSTPLRELAPELLGPQIPAGPQPEWSATRLDPAPAIQGRWANAVLAKVARLEERLASTGTELDMARREAATAERNRIASALAELVGYSVSPAAISTCQAARMDPRSYTAGLRAALAMVKVAG